MSKWGFNDGDLFQDFVNENDYYVRWTSQPRTVADEVLKRVVEKYLLPTLPFPVRLDCFVTPHNGIRVHKDDFDILTSQPETFVIVTEDQVREICEQVKKEYLNEQ
jgi:hypothetical protein